jgi:hypothetical protein
LELEAGRYRTVQHQSSAGGENEKDREKEQERMRENERKEKRMREDTNGEEKDRAGTPHADQPDAHPRDSRWAT